MYLVSRAVRNQVRDRLPIAFEDLGESEVKNDLRPLRVYRILPERPGCPKPGRSRGRGAPPERPALRVLPFGSDARRRLRRQGTG